MIDIIIVFMILPMITTMLTIMVYSRLVEKEKPGEWDRKTWFYLFLVSIVWPIFWIVYFVDKIMPILTKERTFKL